MYALNEVKGMKLKMKAIPIIPIEPAKEVKKVLPFFVNKL